MRAMLLVLVMRILAVGWCGPAAAQEQASGTIDSREQKVEVEIDKSQVSSEFKKILELEEKAAREINNLSERMKVSDDDQIAELQSEIESIKHQTEIAILRVRLEIARQRDDQRNVQEIEKALYQLENPIQFTKDQESEIVREAWEKENQGK
jgi:hypothetical protein